MVHLYLKANSFDSILELPYIYVITVLIMGLMTNLYNKNNLLYVLLSLIPITVSGAFMFFPSVIAFNISPVLILYSCILSVLVIAITYKIISNNRKIEIEKNKFLQKEKELKNEKQQLEEKIKELENEQANSYFYDEVLIEEKEKLRNEISELKSQLYELHDINERKIEELKDKLNESFNQKLQKETSLQNVEVTKLQEKITQLQRTLEKNIKEIRQLNAQLKSEEEINQSLERKITDIDNEKKKLLSDLDKEKKQNEKLQNEYDNHIKDLSELRNKNDSLSNKIQKQVDKISDLENKNLSLNANYLELEAEIDKLRKKNIELGEEIKKLKLNISSKSKESDISIRDNDNSQSLNNGSNDLSGFGEIDNQSFQKPKPPFTSTPKKLKTPLKNMGNIEIQYNNNQHKRSPRNKSDKDKENSKLNKSSIINRNFSSSLRMNNFTTSNKTI